MLRLLPTVLLIVLVSLASQFHCNTDTLARKQSGTTHIQKGCDSHLPDPDIAIAFFGEWEALAYGQIRHELWELLICRQDSPHLQDHPPTTDDYTYPNN